MRRLIGAAAIIVGVLILGLAAAGPATANGNPPPNTNEVAYWCPSGGVKYDLDGLNQTTFTVPAPPAGQSWSLLVLKAGHTGEGGVVNENETFTDPVVGQSYSHSSGKNISHAILCYGGTTTTGATTTGATTTAPTTTQGSTTTVPCAEDEDECVTTTTAPTTTQATTTTLPVTTTAPFVTNPCPGSGCPQTTPPTTVATTPPTSAAVTTVAVTTIPDTTAVDQTVPPAVVTQAPELPHTGAMTVPEIAVGLLIGGAGLALLAASRTDKMVRGARK